MEALRKLLDQDRFAKQSGVRLVSVSPGHAVAEMTLTPDHWNGIGNAQGGAIFTLADLAFAAASNSHGTIAVAVNVSITFIKAAKGGTLRADARELSKNFKLGSYTVEVTDEAGDLIAIFQGLAYRKQDKIPAG